MVKNGGKVGINAKTLSKDAKGDFKRKVAKVGRKVKKANVTTIKVQSKFIQIPLQQQILEGKLFGDDYLGKILKNLSHYSNSSREAALNELQEFISSCSSLDKYIAMTFPAALELLYDEDRDVRKRLLIMLTTILLKLPSDSFNSIIWVTITYLSGGLTNLHKGIRRDSLSLLLVLSKYHAKLLLPSLDKLVSLVLGVLKDTSVMGGSDSILTKASENKGASILDQVHKRKSNIAVTALETIAALLASTQAVGTDSEDTNNYEDTTTTTTMYTQRRVRQSNLHFSRSSISSPMDGSNSGDICLSIEVMESLTKSLCKIWQGLVLDNSMVSTQAIDILVEIVSIMHNAQALFSSSAYGRKAVEVTTTMKTLLMHFPYGSTEASLATPGSDAETRALDRVNTLNLGLCELVLEVYGSYEIGASREDFEKKCVRDALDYLSQSLGSFVSKTAAKSRRSDGIGGDMNTEMLTEDDNTDGRKEEEHNHDDDDDDDDDDDENDDSSAKMEDEGNGRMQHGSINSRINENKEASKNSENDYRTQKIFQCVYLAVQKLGCIDAQCSDGTDDDLREGIQLLHLLDDLAGALAQRHTLSARDIKTATYLVESVSMIVSKAALSLQITADASRLKFLSSILLNASSILPRIPSEPAGLTSKLNAALLAVMKSIDENDPSLNDIHRSLCECTELFFSSSPDAAGDQFRRCSSSLRLELLNLYRHCPFNQLADASEFYVFLLARHAISGNEQRYFLQQFYARRQEMSLSAYVELLFDMLKAHCEDVCNYTERKCHREKKVNNEAMYAMVMKIVSAGDWLPGLIGEVLLWSSSTSNPEKILKYIQDYAMELLHVDEEEHCTGDGKWERFMAPYVRTCAVACMYVPLLRAMPVPPEMVDVKGITKTNNSACFEIVCTGAKTVMTHLAQLIRRRGNAGSDKDSESNHYIGPLVKYIQLCVGVPGLDEGSGISEYRLYEEFLSTLEAGLVDGMSNTEVLAVLDVVLACVNESQLSEVSNTTYQILESIVRKISEINTDDSQVKNLCMRVSTGMNTRLLVMN